MSRVAVAIVFVLGASIGIIVARLIVAAAALAATITALVRSCLPEVVRRTVAVVALVAIITVALKS